MPSEVLKFWFEELQAAQWWTADAALDAQIRARFAPLVLQAIAGELSAWRSTAQGRLAEIMVLDQFSRNIYRGSPQAFAQDAQALALAQEAVASGALSALAQAQRSFLLLPYMHSESRWIHTQALSLFQQHASANSYDFELKHKAIIDRFGRYPHRNAVLGRESSPEELQFLTQPGSSF